MGNFRKYISLMLILAMLVSFASPLMAEDVFGGSEENEFVPFSASELAEDTEGGDFVEGKKVAVVLLLDVSYSMEENGEKPFKAMKSSAKEFCRTILEKNPDVQISLVRQYGYSQVVRFEGSRNWSNNIDELEKTIDGIGYGSATGIESAFNEADKLLDKIDADQKVIINMSDGAPNRGTQIRDGELFTKEEIDAESSSEARSYMECANGVQAYVNKIENKYQIFSIGFFHADPGKTKKDTIIGTKLMQNAHNAGYYDATDDVELSNAYREIVEIVASPVSFRIRTSLIDKASLKYKVNVEVKNNNRKQVAKNSQLKIIVPETAVVVGDSVKSIGDLRDIAGAEFEIEIDKDKFEQGGRFIFEIEYSADLLGSFKQRGLIAIVNNKDEFKFGRDSWSFENYSSRFNINDIELESLYRNIEPSERKKIEGQLKYFEYMYNDPTEDFSLGRCYGMVATALLNHARTLDGTDLGYSSGQSLYDVNKSKGEAPIDYYYLQQFLKPYRAHLAAVKKESFKDFKNNSANVMKKIIENIDSKKNRGTALPMVGFTWKIEETGTYAGHVVVATDYELASESSDKSKFAYNGKNYDVRVQFYDPNFPELDKSSDYYYGNSYMLFNLNDNHWMIPAYGIGLISNNNKHRDVEAYIDSYTNDVDVVRGVDRRVAVDNLYDEIAFGQKFEKSKLNVKDKKTNRTWVIDVVNKILSDGVEVNPNKGFLVSKPSNARMNYILPTQNSSYEVYSEDQSSGIEAEVTYTDKYIHVGSETSKKANIDYNGTVDLEDNNGKFSVTIADDNTYPTTFNAYTIDGEWNGDLKFVKTEDGIKLYGDFTGGTITFEDKYGVVGRKKIEVNEDKSASYYKQGNRLETNEAEAEYKIEVTKSDDIISYSMTEANGKNESDKYKDGSTVIIKDIVADPASEIVVKTIVKGSETILEKANDEYKFVVVDDTKVIITTVGSDDTGNETDNPNPDIVEPSYPGYHGYFYEGQSPKDLDNGYTPRKEEPKKQEPKKEEPKKEENKDNILRVLYFYLDKGYYEMEVNGQIQQIPMDVQPVAINQRTMLPIRFVAEAIGATVEWHQDTKSATFTKDGITATITLGKDEITVSDGRTIKMDAEPTVISQRIMVPLTNISQIFGMTNGDLKDGVDNDIEWDQENYRVIIKIKK